MLNSASSPHSALQRIRNLAKLTPNSSMCPTPGFSPLTFGGRFNGVSAACDMLALLNLLGRHNRHLLEDAFLDTLLDQVRNGGVVVHVQLLRPLVIAAILEPGGADDFHLVCRLLLE